jgi:hypothetical protein
MKDLIAIISSLAGRWPSADIDLAIIDLTGYRYRFIDIDLT